MSFFNLGVRNLKSNLECGQIINKKWKIEKIFPESGQGQSAIVKNNEEYGVIKILKDTKESNIKRFNNEIVLLRKMESIERIPSIIDVNQDDLYYIMQYIEGCDLEAAISNKKNRRKFDKIITAIMSLLEIVENYAKLGIVHRDIKPGNILCCGGNIEELYLIDFGIGYDNNYNENLTEISEQLGNRFLRLPELLNGNKRDIRSDITLCVGILFFMITNTVPVSIIDENEKMPHQTTKGIENLQWIGSRNLQILNKIFDKGFRNKIEERFQRVDDLVFALNELNISENNKAKKRPTDSYCLDTIQSLFNDNVNRIGNGINKLISYNGKRISVGNIAFKKIDDEQNLYIELPIFDLSRCIKGSNYYSTDFNGLFISKKKFDQKNSEGNYLYELTAKMTVEEKKIVFDDFSLNNYEYEYPVKKIIEPLFKINIEKSLDKKNIFINKEEVIILNDKSLSVYSIYNTFDPYKIDISNIIDENGDGILSNNKKYFFYTNYIDCSIWERNGYNFIVKESQALKNIKLNKLVDYKFCADNLILVFENRLVIIDIQNDCLNEYYNISFGYSLIDKLKGLNIVSEEGNYCFVNMNRTRKIYINFSNNETCKIGFWDFYNNIIDSNESEFIYKTDGDIIIKKNVKNHENIVISDKNEGLSSSYILRRPIYKIYNYYFTLLGYDGSKGRIGIFKIINNKMVLVGNIDDFEDITEIWRSGRFIVSIDKGDNLTIWKING